MILRGSVRGRLTVGDGGCLVFDWASNLICFRGLDLIGGLLCDRPGLTGITWLAVGSGEDSWDAAPPAPDRSRTALTAEVLRIPLVAGEHLSYAGGAVDVRVSLDPGMATGVLREVGLFGGDASARPGSGYLVNHKAHARIDKGAGDTLDRQIRLQLAAALGPGARDLIGGLLARSGGLRGLAYVALGTNGSTPGQPPTALLAEAWRAPLDRGGVRYEAAVHAVTVDVAVPYAAGPPTVAEAGLFGGAAGPAAGSGMLVDRQVFAPIDRTVPVPLRRRFVLSLVAAQPVAVPAVTGRPLADARTVIAAADLLTGAVTEADGGGQPAGTVLTQKPAAGAQVAEGTAVALSVAAAHTIEVPQMLGSPVDGARALLVGIGLTVADPVAFVPTDGPLGTVLAAQPPPGTRVPVGAQVELTVGAARQVSVPDVRGRTPGAAGVLLSAAGLTLAPPPYQVREGGSTAGSVVAQDPAPGTRASAGTTVTITLAVPWTVGVPDLHGVALTDAPAALRAAAADLLATLQLPPDPPGLSLGGTSERVAAPGETVGTVVGQTPAAGTRAQLYATVAVVVAAPAQHVVPDLAGLDLGAAAAALAAAGFALGAVGHRASDVPPGTVVDQDPVAGSGWPPGGRVGVTVATPVTVVVPNVIGLEQQSAAEALSSRSLEVGAVQTAAAGAAARPGAVVRQAPAAGTIADKGSAVDLTVAAGVPNLLGLTSEAASAALRALGLVPRVVTQPSDATPDTVIAQDPPAGSAATPGETVTVTVAIARRVPVPNVVGQPFAAAVTAVANAGLTLVSGGQKPDATVAEGTVVALDPPAGTRLDRGSAVTATLAVAPPTPVPALIGLSQADATAKCSAVSLGLQVTGTRPTAGVTPGTVVDQDPAAGTGVRAGTVVSVVLASMDNSVAVPDLRGRTTSAAEEIAKAAGLVMSVGGSQLSLGPPDTVLSQDVLPGTRVPVGSTVNVVVSVAAVRLPDVVASDVTDAQNGLQSLGLVVTIHPVRRPADPGTVLGQNPAAGTVVAVGSTVVLVYSTGIRPPIIGGGGIRPIPPFPLIP